MTAFSSAADKHAGETVIALISITDGSTTYRWSTSTDVFDETNNVWYEPRIVDIGPVDRATSMGAPVESDLTVSLANVDGGLDALLSDFGTFSPFKTTVTVSVGFASLPVSDYRKLATMHYAGVSGVSGDRVITVEFISDINRKMGSIVCPTYQEVYDALTVVDSTNWPTDALEDGNSVVPVVLGRYPLDGTTDGVDAKGWLESSNTVGAQAFRGTYRFVAVSKYDFDTSRMMVRPVLREDDDRFRRFRHQTETDLQLTWDSISITLDGVTRYVLVVKTFKYGDGNVDLYYLNADVISFSCEPAVPGSAANEDWRIVDLVRGIIESAENSTSWAADADTAGWSDIDSRTGTVVRVTLAETTQAGDVLDEALTQCSIESYVDTDGKLAGLWVSPSPGVSPDYSAVGFTEEDDALTFRAALPDSGRWSAINVVHGRFSDAAKAGVQNESILTNMPFIGNVTVEGATVAGGGSGNSSIKIESATNITRQGRRLIASVGGSFLSRILDAAALARRELDLRTDPRWVITVDFPWRAARIEMGDIVEVTHTAVPGWASARACVVYGISYDMGRHMATVTLVDFDAYLRGKVCLYDTMADWVVSEFSDDSLTAAIVNGSSVITFSDSGKWEDALAGDIFETRSTDNQWQGIIASVNPGAKTITLESAGGEVGPLPSTYVSEATNSDWKVLRSQKNRGTSSTNYAVQDDKYGCYGGQDGFFLDDSEAAYTYQR